MLTLLFQGHVHVVFPVNEQISVEADAIACSAGSVNIAAHLCKLTFGAKTATLTGRKAHELYVTLAQAMIPPVGTAGTMYESLSHLVCTIKPHEIAKKSGGGADCSFDAGPSPGVKSSP